MKKVFRLKKNASFPIKLDLKMKLTTLFVIVSLFQLQANESYGQKTKITLALENVSIEKVLDKIESLTEFKFIYKDSEVNYQEIVSVNVKRKQIGTILKKLFADSNIIYKVVDKQIILKPREIIAKTNNKKETINDNKPQGITVKGVVSDSNGLPLIGASILEKGTTNGTQTGFDGKFTLNVTDNNAILVASYLGFKTKEVIVNEQTTIAISLEEDAAKLEEIIVVGYGEQTKRNLTTAVSTMKTSKIEGLPFSNMGDAVSGRLPGIIINGGSSSPGSTPVISIRGGGTPLVVIDGVVTEDIQQFYSLNPKDIENISFLKDGASAAVYGARASNGIVVVTTKTGTSGKLNINYSNNFAFTSPTIKRNFISSYDWALAQNDGIFLHDGTTFGAVPEADLIKFRDQSDPINFPNSNWYDATYKNSAPQQQQHLSVGGGSGDTDYYFSVGHLNQGSIYESKVGTFKRYNLISNITTNFDKIGLKTAVKLSAVVRNLEEPAFSVGTIAGHVQNSLPTSLIFNPDGTYSSVGDHPVAESDSRSGYNRNNRNIYNGQLTLDWKAPFLDGLSVKILGNYKYIRQADKNWNAPTEQFDLDGNVVNASSRPDLVESNSFSGEYTIEAHLNYAKTFKKHDIKITSVYTQRKFKDELLAAARFNFLSSAVDQIFAGPTEGATSFGSASTVARQGIVGRVSYGYAGKYFLEGSYRYDGTDNFAEGKRWGFFPSISAGWLLSEEKFLDSKLFDLLKLRFSFASVGNDGTLQTPEFPGISRLAYIRSFNLVPNVLVVDGQLVSGFNEGGFPSPDLTWFTTKKYNLGLDFGVLDNKLSGSVEYFYNRTSGFLQPPADVYSTPLGTSLPTVKSDNSFRRHGIEVSANYRNQIGDLKYSIGANTVWNERLWERFNEDSVQLKNPRTRITHRKNTNGEALTDLGLYQNVNDIIDNPALSSAGGSLRPGDIRYQDINGDGKIDDSDFTQQGKASFPSLSFGFNIDLEYKAWSLRTQFQGASNRNIFINDELINRNSRTITYDYQLDYWTPTNTGASFPRVVRSDQQNAANNAQASSYWLKNARYLRAKSIQLTYDLKKGALSNFDGLSGLTLSLSGTNLLTWSPVKDFIDPESDSTRGFNYPVQKTISFGINATF